VSAGRTQPRDRDERVLRAEPDLHVDTRACGHCGGEARRVYGALRERRPNGGERRCGRYSADMCLGSCDPTVVLELQVRTPARPRDQVRFSVLAWAEADEYRMHVLEAAGSTAVDLGRAARSLGRSDVLAHAGRDWLFHAADHVVLQDPRVQAQLERRDVSLRRAPPT